jgi:16S rRNA (adenine1518-N6/adenine1519-N6)-dimethyltransferase
LLRRHGLRPRKNLGQNFLLNEGKVRRIAEAATEAAAQYGGLPIVEVGPGLGALTTCLVDLGGEVLAYEIDRSLEAPLIELLADYPKARVVFEDFLHADPAAALEGRDFVLAGNLPYQITAPLLEKMFLEPHCRAGIVTVQKEVADRLRAQPGSKAYGPLTLFCDYYVESLEVICRLVPEDFLPAPAIDSTAVRLTKRATPPFITPSAEAYFRAVRAAFNHRRKSLRSGLALATILGLSKPRVAEALAVADIDGERRAETLTTNEFARLAGALDAMRETGDV